MKESKENRNIYKIALLVSISCVLQISESLIPHPIPGLRLGLANVITLIALVTLGFGYTMEITVLRTVLSSFIMGTFMSPTFILSFSGGVISTLIMGFLYWLSNFHKRYRLSIVGISIVGALTHNTVQLYLAYLLLVKHPGIFIFFPWLCIGAVIMGWITGVVAGDVCLKLKENQGKQAIQGSFDINYSPSPLSYYFAGNSLLHRLPAEMKIAAVILFSLIILIFNNPWLYYSLLFSLAFLAVFYRASLFPFLSRTKKYASLVLTAFLLPVFFNSGRHVLSTIAYFKITSEGVSQGALFASRIVFLILANSLLIWTTSPQALTAAFAKILSPLRKVGIPEKRIALILSLSLTAIPFLWEAARNSIRKANLKKVKNLRNLIPLLSDFITRFYLEAEQVSAFWENES